MKSFTYVIKDEIGLHARPAGMLVNEAKKYTSKITIGLNGKSVDARKLMGVMSLGVKNGDKITVEVEGDDEVTAAENVEKFLQANV